MIEINDKTHCCGCHACYNICPKNAIEMKEDDKGFKYPIIDKNKCINCGLCNKVCPILNSKEEQHDIKAYAMYNKNEGEREKSSSGGIFILLAKEIIKRNGVVFGASFDEKFNVCHLCIDNVDDIDKLQGSKYVQSCISDTYKKAKEFLEKDKYVLFTGTPCQIEGLYSYLLKKYDKLYTQDIVCHGVPSPKVWNKYKEYRLKHDKQKPKTISFRNKNNGWKSYNIMFNYENGIYINNHKDDIYMKSFLRNTCLRDSCYNCSFKKKYRKSDITLADYWGVENICPKMDDDMGTSLVLINSVKGQQLFNLIKDKCVYQETELEYINIYNPAYVKSVVKDKNHDNFFNKLDKLEFDKLVKRNVSKTSFLKKVFRKIKKIYEMLK